MTPDIERAVRASCDLTECGYPACREFNPRCGAHERVVIAVLEALAEPSDAAVEPAAEAIYQVKCEGRPKWSWQIATKHNFVDVVECRTEARAALRAARLAELGRTE